MSDVIDWSKAPEGATHWNVVNHRFYILSSYVKHWSSFSEKWLTGGRQDEYDLQYMIPCPQPTTRSGEGLPPVGTVLEFLWNFKPDFSEYVNVKVVAHAGKYAILKVLTGPHCGQLRESAGGVCGGRNVQPIFRLIRTAEQIAADERSKYCDRIYGAMCKVERQLNRSDMAEALYDAGLRFSE